MQLNTIAVLTAIIAAVVALPRPMLGPSLAVRY